MSNFAVILGIMKTTDRPSATGASPERQHASRGRNSLVLIRPGGTKPPLFLVHGGFGETILYINLARRLDADRPVYGLQPPSREDGSVAYTRTVEMAAYHIGKIRSIQPHGPYLLGGTCAGGVIAFEIARQLQSQNEQVAMVALIDAPDVAARRKRWRVAKARARSFSTVFQRDGSARHGHTALGILIKAARKARNLITYAVSRTLNDLSDNIRMHLLRAYLDRGRPLPSILRGISVLKVCLFAERGYRPETPFDGEVLLFRATSGEADDEPFIERFEDPLFGWGRRATCGVRVFDVPGGHFTMLREPNVAVMAAQMQGYLNQIQAVDPSLAIPSSLWSTAVTPNSVAN